MVLFDSQQAVQTGNMAYTNSVNGIQNGDLSNPAVTLSQLKEKEIGQIYNQPVGIGVSSQAVEQQTVRS